MLELKEERAREVRSVWDKLEIYARPLRYGFLVTAAAIFIASNLVVFPNLVLKALFLAFGVLWILSVAYIDVREGRRFSHGLPPERSGQVSFSRRRQGRNRIVRWLRTHATITGVLVVFGAAMVLYVVPLYPSKPWWGVILIALGPLATWWSSKVGQRGRGNENLIRQLQSLVKDAKDLEFTIRSFSLDLLSKQDTKTELGAQAVHGWSSYVNSVGAWQLKELSSLGTDLNEADPFEQIQVINCITSFSQILGRVLEVELKLTTLCQGINTIPAEARNRWEFIQQAHQRLGTQLSSLKPILTEMGRGDLFDTFINQRPQNLGK
jgi:hypothetical protein